MQVVGKLREGVQLREVSTCLANRGPVVYELTPYEVLMEDIRMRRYSLKNPPVSAVHVGLGLCTVDNLFGCMLSLEEYLRCVTLLVTD